MNSHHLRHKDTHLEFRFFSSVTNLNNTTRRKENAENLIEIF